MTGGAICRSCGAPLKTSFCDLGMSPPSNAYVTADQRHRMEAFFPLHALVCDACFLVQLDQFQLPDDIFSDYAYFSSYSDSWLAHCKAYADMAIRRFALGPASRVVEIASNDGYLLQYFVSAGVPALGVEPAANVAGVARRKGIETIVRFFGVDTARALAADGMHADLLIGNNVLAHVPAVTDFVAGLKILLKPRGVVTMEFPHLLTLMEQNQFDTIYHEHFSYFSLLSVSRLFERLGLVIFDVERLPTHGGSLRIYVRHAEDTGKAVSANISDFAAIEKSAGLDRIGTYRGFAHKVKAVKRDLLGILIAEKRAGKSIVGYGAAAKGNTLLNYCGIRDDFIDYVADRNPHKQGRYLPGTHIPIVGPERIAETGPDYVLVLPWNIKDEIMTQLDDIRRWGGKFIVPIPKTVVLS